MIRTMLAATVLAAIITPAAAADQPAGSADTGKALYMTQGCWQCHGRVAQGGGAGPRLAPPVMPLSDFTTQLREPRAEMPPYTHAVLSEAQLADIHAFLQTIPPPPALEGIALLK